MIQPVQTTKQGNPIKKAAKAAVATAVAAGGVLYLAKKGKLNPAEGDNFIIKNVKNGLRKPSNFILQKGEALISAMSAKFPKVSKKVANFKKTIIDLKDTAADLKDRIGLDKKIDTLKDFVESKFNKQKFFG